MADLIDNNRLGRGLFGFAINDLYSDYNGGGYASKQLVDITAGNNGYQAAAGWDFVTGIGTPDWELLSSQF